MLLYRLKTGRVKKYNVARQFALIATPLTILVSMVEAFRTGSVHFGVFYAGILVILGLAALMLRPKMNPDCTLGLKHFNITGGVYISMSEKAELESLIDRSQSLPIVLTGRSGSGKSTLLRKVLSSQKAESCTKLEIEDYCSSVVDFKNTVFMKFTDDAQLMLSEDKFRKSGLEGVDAGSRRILLCFDQFEKFFDIPTSSPEELEELKDWFKKLILALLESNPASRVLIVIRQDRFLELDFLKEYTSQPDQVLHLVGLEAPDNSACFTAMKKALQEVHLDPDEAISVINSLKGYDGRVLPFEFQLIGMAYELGIVEKTEEDFMIPEAVIHALLRRFIYCSDDSDTTLKVLYAFSQAKRLRCELDIAALQRLLRTGRKQLEQCINFLLVHELIKEVNKANSFELIHDFLADRLLEVSGQDLDPVDRDSIAYFTEALKSDKIRRAKDERRDVRPALSISSVYLGVILLLRLSAPAFHGHFGPVFFNMGLSQPLISLIDINFLPILVSHALLSFYIFRLFSGIFRPVDGNSILNAAFTYLALIGCLAGVTLAVFSPQYWVVSVSGAAALVGIKFWSLSGLNNLASIAKRKLRESATLTLFNSTILFVFGWVIITFVNNRANFKDFSEYYTSVVVIMSAMLVYFWFNLDQQHTSNSAISRLMGMIDRRPSGFETVEDGS